MFTSMRKFLMAGALGLSVMAAPAAMAQGWHDGYFSGGFSTRHDAYGPYGHLTHPRAIPNYDYRALGPRYFRSRPAFRPSQMDIVPNPQLQYQVTPWWY